MFEGIVFQLELIMSYRASRYVESKIVTSCPAPELMKELYLKYRKPGLQVIVTCNQVRAEIPDGTIKEVERLLVNGELIIPRRRM